MLINEILDSSNDAIIHELSTIHRACGQFLADSHGSPLYKLLPKAYKDVHRVKVRQQRYNNELDEAFNKAFESNFRNIRQRAVFAVPTMPMQTESTEPFYVFPLDGYKFLYSREVKNSSADYQQVMNVLVEQFNNDEAINLVTDILKYTYVQTDLNEGIESGSEIILYGIPAYYAIRVSSVTNYNKIIGETYVK